MASSSASRLVDFDAIEHSKENIEPIPRGRSAIALAKAFQQPTSPQDRHSVQATLRAQFEKDLVSANELDDPLEVWLKYIKWTDETFPQGQSTESGIARLLERCTEQFKNDKQYKSDPRYLRVWLAYSTYSDSPLEIFAFLQRNEIGQELALYYEEYAAVLEKMNRKRKADEVFQMGLLAEARPLDRLRRRYTEFQRRLQINPPDPNEPSTPPAPLRTILGASQITVPSAGVSRPRPKIQVYTDTEETEVRPGSAGWESIGRLADRKKENTIAAKPWVGEKLPMRAPTAAPAERLVVFRDEAQQPQQPKRNHEHVAVNLEQIYVDSEEFSFEELLAKKRGLYGLKFEKPKSPVDNVFLPLVEKTSENAFKSTLRSPLERVKRSPLQQKLIIKTPSPQSSSAPSVEKPDSDDDDVVYMPIRDEDSTPRKPLKKRPSPTINTKAALDDIIDIFSQPLKSQEELEQEDSSSDDESDAASLTSRSFGNHSDFEGPPVNESSLHNNPPPMNDETLEHDASVIQVSAQIATLRFTPENEDKSSDHITKHPSHLQDSHLTKDPPPTSSFVTPPQQFVFPAPVPLLQQGHPQPAPVPERRFNLNLMTPIEERTESSIFQHSADESTTTTLQSPLPSKFHTPRTPSNNRSSSTPTLDSSPFQEYIPTMPKAKATVKKPILPNGEKRPYPQKPIQGPIINETTCNPMDPYIHAQIFDNIRPSLDTYEGYDTTSSRTESKQIAEIERFITKMSRKDGATTHHMEMRLQLGDQEYLIRKKLGQGAYAPVFLAEVAGTGALHAIKIEKSPPRKWEFYLMRQAKRRLGVSRAGSSMIDALALHMFRDESFLVLEYRDQGTILDLVNFAKNVPLGDTSTGVMDEVLAMFFTVELLRTVEALHSKQILHGDLKADNCLVRFEAGDLPVSYRRDGSEGWSSKGIALIDFGRGIDLKLFPEKVQFICEWETDEQDCPEMRDARPWSYQVDYWGLAGIIHSMLWGKYITTRQEVVGVGNRKRHVLREGLKRYWQQDLWRGLLEVLMNPTLQEGGALPITDRLRGWREKMEDWLEANSERGMGLRGIIGRIEKGVGK